jgi:cerevisin
VHFSVAAGNDNIDACNTSPASAIGVLAVGATTPNDKMAFFSNYGRCTTLYAPGFDIESAWIGSNNDTKVMSGTSMAAPHGTCSLFFLFVAGNAHLTLKTIISGRDFGKLPIPTRMEILTTS